MKKRNCPECDREIIYRNANSFYRVRKLNSLCNHCKQIRNRNSFYGKKFSKEQIEKWKRERSGKGNPMFGTEGGMKGKKQSEYQKKRQSDYMRKRWLKEYGVKRNKWSEFKKYRFEVDRLTKQNPLYLLKNFDKRGRAGIPGAYHLDHIYIPYITDLKMASQQKLLQKWKIYK